MTPSKEYIEKLIALYYNGNTTLEEERTLKAYFNGTESDPSFGEHRHLFIHWAREAEQICPGSESIPRKALDESRKRTRRQRIRRLWLLSASAAALLTLALVYSLLSREASRKPLPPRQDEEMARIMESYTTAIMIITDVSEKLNRGLEPLETIGKVEKGFNAMESLQKGLSPLENLFPQDPNPPTNN